MIRKLMNRVGGAGLAAGGMYFFDPDSGRRRRMRVRDQVYHYAGRFGAALGAAGRDLAHRARGFAAATFAPQRQRSTTDRNVYERVRAEFNRYVSHPRAIGLEVENGRITLYGPILRHEMDALLQAVAAVAGVREVENRLEAHDHADAIPALQGGTPRRGDPPNLFQADWSPATRLVAGFTGAGMTVYGLRRRNPVGYLMGLAGLLLLARGANHLGMRPPVERR